MYCVTIINDGVEEVGNIHHMRYTYNITPYNMTIYIRI